MRRLTREAVPSATAALAQFLIGVRLVRQFDDGQIISGRIVETEAYTADDPASHSFRGRTARNEMMFTDYLHAYVYFIYGTAFCLNVSSEAAGIGAAVLIRALEPTDGMSLAPLRRGATCADRDLLRGPGRICRAFDIDRRLNGVDLASDSRLWLAQDDTPKPAVGVSVRIGLSQAAERELRFYASGSRFLSGRRTLSPELDIRAVAAADDLAQRNVAERD